MNKTRFDQIIFIICLVPIVVIGLTVIITQYHNIIEFPPLPTLAPTTVVENPTISVSPTNMEIETRDDEISDSTASSLDASPNSTVTSQSPVATSTIFPTSSPTETIDNKTEIIQDAVDNGIIEVEFAQQIQQNGTADAVVNLLPANAVNQMTSEELQVVIARAKTEIVNLLNIPASALTQEYTHIPALALQVDEDALALLAENGYVSYIQRDYEMITTQSEAEDPPVVQPDVAPITEILGLTDAAGNRVTAATGEGVRIVIMDSGIDANLSIFDDNTVVYKECFLENEADCLPGIHGTLMAAIIHEIAPSTELIDFQTLHSNGTGVYSTWLSALDRLVEIQMEWDIDIVNMSLATSTLFAGQCDTIYPAASAAFYQLDRAGVSLFAAIGNDGLSGRTASPACLRTVQGIGATYINNDVDLADRLNLDDGSPPCETYLDPPTNISPLQIACYSNRDSELKLMIPATGVKLAHYPDNVPTYGTSQATAEVSGIAAVLLSINPYIFPAQLFQIMSDSGEKVTVESIGRTLQVPVLTANGISTAITTTQDTVFSCSDVTTLIELDCNTLIDFYHATSGPTHWTNHDGWNENFDPCQWYGVDCTGRRVTALRLSFNGLSNSGSNIALPAIISNLTELVELRLAGNQIDALPQSLTTLDHLIEADFSYNPINIYNVDGTEQDDTPLIKKLNEIDPDFRETQTYAPININAWTPSATQLNILWSPIFYDNSPGFYRVSCGLNPSGPYDLLVKDTVDKMVSNVTFTEGIVPNDRYYCIVNTFSTAFPNRHPDLVSSASVEVMGSTRPEDIGGAQLVFNPVADVFVSSTTDLGDRAAMFIGNYQDFTLADDPRFLESAGLIDFGILPLSLPVESVTLTVSVYGTNPGFEPTIHINSVFGDRTDPAENWTEATRWDNRPTIGSLSFGTFTFPDYDAVGGAQALTVEANLTNEDAFLSYVQGSTNNGIMLHIPGTSALGSNNGSVICSSEGNTGPCSFTAHAPEILITLDAAPPVSNRQPADGMVNVAVNPTVFSWDTLPDAQGDDTVSRFYVGYAEDALTEIQPDDPALRILSDGTYRYDGLDYGREVFWRIDTVDANNSSNVNEGEVWSFWTSFCEPSGAVDKRDCDALSAFYESHTGDNWVYNASPVAPIGAEVWMMNPVCEWYGVVCDAERVVELHLADMGIVGEDISALGNLSELRYLNLDDNTLGIFPDQLTNLTKLQVFSANNSMMRGILPSTIGNMQALEELHIANNRFNMQLPVSMASLTNLRTLYISNNDFEGDPFPILGSLTQLETLQLDHNRFVTTTNMQGVGNLTSLTVLDISHNGIGFFLPVELANLPLVELDIRANRLELPQGVDTIQLETFLNSLQPNWMDSQVIPPVITAPIDPNDPTDGWEPANNSITIEFESIPYASALDPSVNAYYQAKCTSASIGESAPPTDTSNWIQTPNLSSLSLVYDDLFPATPHECEFRSYVARHISTSGEEQKNSLFSRPADIVRPIPTAVPDLVGNSLDNPLNLPEEELPFKSIIDMQYMETYGEGDPTSDPPECVTGETGKKHYSYFSGGDGSTPLEIIAQGREGADTALAIITQNEAGELVYVSCIPNIEDTETAAANLEVGQASLVGEDAVLTFYPQPGADYYIVTISENGTVGSIELSVAFREFNSCEDRADVSLLECEALVELYNTTSGPSDWIRDDNWLQSAYLCDWHGVQCSPRPDANGNRIIGLSLPANQITGQLSESFGNLTALQRLNLEYNELRSELPSSITDLTNLNSVNISYNMIVPSNDVATNFLLNIRSDAFDRMTIPPTNIRISKVDANSVLVSWDPLTYVSRGYIEIGVSDTLYGPYDFVPVGDKNTTSYLLNLQWDTTHIVLAVHSEEDQFFPRRVKSDPSPDRVYEKEALAINPIEVCWLQDRNNAESVWRITNDNPIPITEGAQQKVLFDWAVYESYDASGEALQSGRRYDQRGDFQLNTRLANSIKVLWYVWDNGETLGRVENVIVAADEVDRCDDTEPSTVTPEVTEESTEMSTEPPAATEDLTVDVVALDVCWLQDRNNAESVWQVTNDNSVPLAQGTQAKILFDYTAYDGENGTGNVVQNTQIRQDRNGTEPITTPMAASLVLEYYIWENGVVGERTSVIVNATTDACGL